VEGNLNSTLASASILLKGNKIDAFTEKWVGSILWIGQSPFRKYHKRKNWFVEIFKTESQNELKLDLKDVEFKATKSSGPGGQHTNKTSSAVRASHAKSGISVLVQDSRSQHQNKKIAIERLQEIFEIHQLNNLKIDEREDWKKGIVVQRGNPIKTFSGAQFKEN
jgi:peptide chain release factor